MHRRNCADECEIETRGRGCYAISSHGVQFSHCSFYEATIDCKAFS